MKAGLTGTGRNFNTVIVGTQASLGNRKENHEKNRQPISKGRRV